MRHIFVMGFPGEVGGAGTHLWNNLRLWRGGGLGVTLVPTWGVKKEWMGRLDRLGVRVVETTEDGLEKVEGLGNSVVLSMCNRKFIKVVPRLQTLRCPLVWLPLMTFLSPAELETFAHNPVPEKVIYQSEFQRENLQTTYGGGTLIRGYLDLAEWPFRPTPHTPTEPFVVGRLARSDLDKWSRHTWSIYDRILFPWKIALLMGVRENVAKVLGPKPDWGHYLPPNAVSTKEFLPTLNLMLPVNGGARENWPRVGLEAMASGVPIVAEKVGGWCEMIHHRVTGFLGETPDELSYHASVLANEEDLRLQVLHAARKSVEDLMDEQRMWDRWNEVFTSAGV